MTIILLTTLILLILVTEKVDIGELFLWIIKLCFWALLIAVVILSIVGLWQFAWFKIGLGAIVVVYISRKIEDYFIKGDK